ncbi:DeoR family transcriptional regulator [Kineococcus sp. R8]|uniref:DeoR/GlpR family DNA-binding transcription regulator n=1 Tax=Kineococcus siccus TaxID=2696567 RepID=UPI0014123818|nr:DeoR/GlpR family DNA-binding transcription regulator [Kineococcus siccus]NAZ81946.1 DeoR family transcriptional regulator [Kineococcus siccus]
MPSASAAERRERLAQVVLEEGYCTITELSVLLGVSEMTVRRDVARLAGESRLRAFHGGVGSVSPADVAGIRYSDRDLTMAEAKRAIARHAVEKVRGGDVLGIDAGTTAAQLAALLPTDRQVQVVTPSLPAVNSMAKNPAVSLNCLGGDFHTESLSFAGPATLQAIANLHVDTLFLAASGLNGRGAFCGNSFDAITKRALIEVADRVVLIADSSKFTTSAMVRICGWDGIDCLVIDDGLSAADEAVLRQFGVAVERVAVRSAAELREEAAAAGPG